MNKNQSRNNFSEINSFLVNQISEYKSVTAELISQKGEAITKTKGLHELNIPAVRLYF